MIEGMKSQKKIRPWARDMQSGQLLSQLLTKRKPKLHHGECPKQPQADHSTINRAPICVSSNILVGDERQSKHTKMSFGDRKQTGAGHKQSIEDVLQHS